MQRSLSSEQRLGALMDPPPVGGGHRQRVPEEYNAEYFEPDYGTGDPPEIDIGLNETDGVHAMSLGDNAFTITIGNPDDVEPGEVVLIRLASVTHGFDMEQRRVVLDAEWMMPWDPDLPMLEVTPPDDPNVVPPGYYLLFVVSADGEPSVGQYVRVSSGVMQIWKCPAEQTLVATETSCTTEPSGGACPQQYEQTGAVTLPQAEGPTGWSAGWQVAAPPGTVLDPTAPTANETAAVERLCEQACVLHWADPAIEANCDDEGAFDSPEYFATATGSRLSTRSRPGTRTARRCSRASS
jgi:hypothetical protein